MKKYSEIRCTYYDEEESLFYVDGYISDNPNEEGRVLAKINVDTGEVYFVDNKNKNNKQLCVFIDEFKEDFIKDYINENVNLENYNLKNYTMTQKDFTNIRKIISKDNTIDFAILSYLESLEKTRSSNTIEKA